MLCQIEFSREKGRKGIAVVLMFLKYLHANNMMFIPFSVFVYFIDWYKHADFPVQTGTIAAIHALRQGTEE